MSKKIYCNSCGSEMRVFLDEVICDDCGNYGWIEDDGSVTQMDDGDGSTAIQAKKDGVSLSNNYDEGTDFGGCRDIDHNASANPNSRATKPGSFPDRQKRPP